MADNKEKIQEKIAALETAMSAGDFWSNKDKAQAIIRELSTLKAELEGVGKYDKGDAILSILSGAGGDDAEDFSAILLKMYRKYSDAKGWGWQVIHESGNDHGGYRNITVEIKGKSGGASGLGAYGTLKNESGVHRLVRISPFDSNKKRHTSFSLV